MLVSWKGCLLSFLTIIFRVSFTGFPDQFQLIHIIEVYYIGDMKKAVFFDLYGTLAGFSPSRFQIQSQACKRFGITLTEEGILRGYACADKFMSEQNKTNPLRLMTETQKLVFFSKYEQKILRGSEVEVDLAKASKIWEAIKGIPYDMKIYDDVVPCIQTLKADGLVVGIISNMNISGLDLINKFDLYELVDFAVTSLEVGLEKPHKKIFEEALIRANVANSNAVHVGDQIESDVNGAKNAGLQPILLDRDKNYTSFNGCPRIETMKILKKTLDRF